MTRTSHINAKFCIKYPRLQNSKAFAFDFLGLIYDSWGNYGSWFSSLIVDPTADSETVFRVNCVGSDLVYKYRLLNVFGSIDGENIFPFDIRVKKLMNEYILTVLFVLHILTYIHLFS
jgi:hypothetical protein